MKVRKEVRVICLSLLGGVGVFLLIVACGNTIHDTRQNVAVSSVPTDGKVIVKGELSNKVTLSHSIVKKEDCLAVRGQVRNVGDSNVNCAIILVKWYDNSGGLLFKSSQWVYNVGVSETRDFENKTEFILEGGKPLPIYAQIASYEIEVQKCSY